MLKISFLGDIMCEGPFLNAARNQSGEFSFGPAFVGLTGLLSESDFVIGNLETPIAGDELGYTITEELYSFNTPVEFAKAIKEAGIDLVLTANNHCCDRGIEGIVRTLSSLENIGLSHTGTYENLRGAEPFYYEKNGITIAIISCTATTNAEITGVEPGTEHIHLLDQQIVPNEKEKRRGMEGVKYYIVNNILGLKRYMAFRKMLGMTPLNPVVDNSFSQERVDRYIDRMENIISKAKDKADFVFICPHMGGQFNPYPGKFSKYVMNRLALTKADAIVASHSHIVQKFEKIEGKPCMFSLGNISMSMSTDYIIRDNLPDYGLIVHFYINKCKIKKITFSILKMIEDSTGYIKTVLVSDLYRTLSEEDKKGLLSDIQHIYGLLSVDDNIQCTDKLVQREADLNWIGVY